MTDIEICSMSRLLKIIMRWTWELSQGSAYFPWMDILQAGLYDSSNFNFGKSLFPHIFANTYYLCLFDNCCCTRCKVISHWIFLEIRNIGPFKKYTYWILIWIFSFKKCFIFQILYPLFTQASFLELHWFYAFFINSFQFNELEVLPLCRVDTLYYW